jgi:hypothetical protein
LPAGFFSVGNSLAATVSDNTTFSLMGSYKVSVFKFLAGYEHIKYSNPSEPLTPAPLNGVGFDNIGGYKLAYVNNAAFPEDKILNVYWAGIRYTAMPGLDLVGAFYGYHQNTYGTAANNAKCSTTVAPNTPCTTVWPMATRSKGTTSTRPLVCASSSECALRVLIVNALLAPKASRAFLFDGSNLQQRRVWVVSPQTIRDRRRSR